MKDADEEKFWDEYVYTWNSWEGRGRMKLHDREGGGVGKEGTYTKPKHHEYTVI